MKTFQLNGTARTDLGKKAVTKAIVTRMWYMLFLFI